MFFLRHCLTAALAAAFLTPAAALDSAEQQFERLAAQVKAGHPPSPGETVEVDVDLAASSGFSVEVAGERAQVRYRMAFNQIAEGWSWRPLADPAVDDYYRYKFLPLQSVAVERGEYAHEDKIGVTQQMKVSWRYDYFLAFDNLYDFYPRVVDDDAGFVADLPAAVVGHLGLARQGPPDRAADQREHDLLESHLRQANRFHAEKALSGQRARRGRFRRYRQRQGTLPHSSGQQRLPEALSGAGCPGAAAKNRRVPWPGRAVFNELPKQRPLPD